MCIPMPGEPIGTMFGSSSISKTKAPSSKENQIKEQKAKQETAIDNLLSQYQYEFEQKTEKVGFWKGLANKFTSLLSK